MHQQALRAAKFEGHNIIEQQDQITVNFKEILQKADNVEAKMDPRFNTKVQNLDIRYLRDHYLSNNITAKVLTQEIIIKDFRHKKAKAKDPKTFLVYSNMAELLEQEKKNWKDKKKKF